MARVLCAWELGSGLGHISRLIPIARELRGMGHEVVMALRDSVYMDLARSAGFEVLAAPLLRGPKVPNPSPLNLSDILLNLGYDDARGLHGALAGWRTRFIGLLGPVDRRDSLLADLEPAAPPRLSRRRVRWFRTAPRNKPGVPARSCSGTPARAGPRRPG